MSLYVFRYVLVHVVMRAISLWYVSQSVVAHAIYFLYITACRSRLWLPNQADGT